MAIVFRVCIRESLTLLLTIIIIIIDIKIVAKWCQYGHCIDDKKKEQVG